jgi:hypothetical protein
MSIDGALHLHYAKCQRSIGRYFLTNLLASTRATNDDLFVALLD